MLQFLIFYSEMHIFISIKIFISPKHPFISPNIPCVGATPAREPMLPMTFLGLLTSTKLLRLIARDGSWIAMELSFLCPSPLLFPCTQFEIKHKRINNNSHKSALFSLAFKTQDDGLHY